MLVRTQKATSPRLGLSRQLPLADICRKSLTLAATLLDAKVGDVQMANLGGKPPSKLTAELAKVCVPLDDEYKIWVSVASLLPVQKLARMHHDHT
jgi:hypothetical protein